MPARRPAPHAPLLRVVALCALLISIPLAAANAQAGTAAAQHKRPPLEELLPDHFSFGLSIYSAAGDWPERMARDHGIRWGFAYMYLVDGWQEDYILGFIRRCYAMRALPVLSYYRLLELGKSRGLGGKEWDIVNGITRDKDAMRGYFEDMRRVFEMCAKADGPVILHHEPDSWSFIEWHGTNDAHDAESAVVMVGSTGLAELAGLPDNAAGFGRAILRLRDLYAPHTTYLGFHAKDSRSARDADKTVHFIRGCGGDGWDVLFGDGIGHILSTRDEGWWDAFDEERFKRYMQWYGTITSGVGLKYIHWQAVLGKADYWLMPDYPQKQLISHYIKAGSIAVLMDIRGNPDEGGHSDRHHGYTARPPEGHPAQNTCQALVQRLERYYQQPMPLESKPQRRRRR